MSLVTIFKTFIYNFNHLKLWYNKRDISFFCEFKFPLYV